MSPIALERQIARALELAIRSDRLDVADHLLDALGVVCQDVSLGSPFANACLAVADSIAQEDEARDRCSMPEGGKDLN